jgi:hypothetical protein
LEEGDAGENVVRGQDVRFRVLVVRGPVGDERCERGPLDSGGRVSPSVRGIRQEIGNTMSAPRWRRK